MSSYVFRYISLSKTAKIPVFLHVPYQYSDIGIFVQFYHTLHDKSLVLFFLLI